MSTLQIEEGKFYRRRDGEVVGPAQWRFRDARGSHMTFPWRLTVRPGVEPADARRDSIAVIYTPGGRFYADGGSSPYDLVEEVADPRNGAIPANECVFEAKRDGWSVKHADKPATMSAADIATRAAELVGGDRDRQHGAKQDNFQRIATLWDAWLRIRKEPSAPIGPHDVAIMMALLKAARTQSGAHNPDDAIDHCGYAACAGELLAVQNAGVD